MTLQQKLDDDKAQFEADGPLPEPLFADDVNAVLERLNSGSRCAQGNKGKKLPAARSSGLQR